MAELPEPVVEAELPEPVVVAVDDDAVVEVEVEAATGVEAPMEDETTVKVPLVCELFTEESAAAEEPVPAGNSVEAADTTKTVSDVESKGAGVIVLKVVGCEGALFEVAVGEGVALPAQPGR